MLPLGLLTAISLLLAPAVFSQTVARTPLPTEPLEKYDNPPAVAAPALAISPAFVSHFGPYTSYQVNVDVNGNNRVGDAANEPSICVDRNNPNRMSIGWRQFNSVTSNFREAGFAFTTNGGTRWIAPGVLQNNVFRSDPVLNSDTTGRFFYLSLLQNFFDDLWRSLTGGQSWSLVGPADGGDKQWFTIDNTNSSGHGFQYQSWSTDGNNYGGRQFTRSTNDGLTWMNPINIPNSPAWGTLDVDFNGNVFIGGVNLSTGRIWCVRSTNAKNGAVVPTFDQSRAVNLGGNIIFAEPINLEGLVGQVFLAVDRSGTSTNNNVYMLASVQPSGFTNGSEVMFVRRAGSMMILSITRNGIGSAHFRSPQTGESMWSGTIRVTLLTTSLRSSFILTASTAEIPGRQMSQSATRLTHSSVIQISLSSAIISPSFPTMPAPTSPTPPHSTAKR